MAKYDLDYDLEEAIKRQKIDRKDFEALRNPAIPGVPTNITDKQLALFLDACGSVDEARKVLKIYYDARYNAPEHFLDRDPMSPKIQQCFDAQDYIHLSPMPDGTEVIFHRLSDSKPSSYHFDHAIKTFFMTIDYCLNKKGPRDGVLFLFDMKGVSLGHLTRLKMSSLRKFFHYLQDGVPGKLKGIHVLNVVSFFDKILTLIKPFMSAEVFKLLFLHKSNMDYEEFYEKCVPKCSLPSDFGGDLSSIAELHQRQIKQMMEMREYYVAEEKQRRDFQEKNNKILSDNIKKIQLQNKVEID